MLGTLVNTGAIACGSVLGSLLKKGIKAQYQAALYTAMGLAAAGLGVNAIVQNMPKSTFPVLFILSLALGSLVGAAADLDGRYARVSAHLPGKNLGQGLCTGVLLFCIGTLSILGPIQSALYGDNTYLFTNATLDFVTSTVLASTYGIGMGLAAPILFLWQGGIYLLAGVLSPFLTDALMVEVSIVGGFLILSSGLSILNIKDCKTLNLLPSLLVPPVYFALRLLF
ncbi:MAG: DUF554 domain-containing protein [Oscillospiraceae bacterium]|nr:DUF554 domain-containing protein [Oscillospiraceae bacterium]